MTALSNPFYCIRKRTALNVCLVFSDLKAAYESGSELLQSSFRELEAEANRIAIEVSPVALNSDEIYHILKNDCLKKTLRLLMTSNIYEI